MTEATSNNLNMKIAVLGLGCGGVRTLNALAALPAADKLFLYALDTDGQTLGQSKLPKRPSDAGRTVASRPGLRR